MLLFSNFLWENFVEIKLNKSDKFRLIVKRAGNNAIFSEVEERGKSNKAQNKAVVE
jgi:hypothetical protein